MSIQQSSWHQESPANASASDEYSIYSETGERTRKRHQKSRHGCLRCKRRRIKCGEERPACNHCRRLGKTCQYPTTQTEAGSASESSTMTVTQPGRDSPLYISSLRAQIDAALASTDELDPDLTHLSPLARRHAPESLEHFLQYDRSWLKTPTLQSIMQRQAAPAQVLHEPHLLHAVLAISTAHMAILKPEDQSYGLASALHSQRSLRLYTECLNGNLEHMNVDALYFTSHMLSMLAFIAMSHQSDAQEWQLPTFVEPMRGMAVLQSLPNVTARLREGVWRAPVCSCERWHQHTRERLVSGLTEEISPALAALRTHCNSLTPEEACLYHERIDMLRILEAVSLEPKAISVVSSFVGKAPVEYIARLRNGEEMALLLLLYWSQLFSRYDQWWLTPSARLLHSRLYTHSYDNASSEQMRTILSTIAGAQSDATHP